MTTATAVLSRPGLLRHSRWDALLIALALAQGVTLLVLPSAPVIALGLWWNSNTVAHNFIHRPFFRSLALNRLFSLYLSVLLGIPQSIWRGRHLAHHAGVPWKPRLTTQLVVEVLAVLALWGCMLALAPRFALLVYLPAYLFGLGLCWLHGHYEHGSGTISHYGRLYNWLFFNDGYHVEHHAHPGTHWTRLRRTAEETPSRRPLPRWGRRLGEGVSRWPAILRWLDAFSLESLERLVLRSPLLQRFVLGRHERAFRRLLPHFAHVRRVGIIGGGLFPRTALILRKLLPDAELVVIDASAKNVETARSMLAGSVAFVSAWYDPIQHNDFDLLVTPLAYMGDRGAFYREPPAPVVLVHDWLWRRHQPGVVVSFLLCKRLNVVKR